MEGCLHLEDVDRSSILGRHPEFQVYRFNTLFQWYCSDTPQVDNRVLTVIIGKKKKTRVQSYLDIFLL